MLRSAEHSETSPDCENSVQPCGQGDTLRLGLEGLAFSLRVEAHQAEGLSKEPALSLPKGCRRSPP
jgi:hypothetical protein